MSSEFGVRSSELGRSPTQSFRFELFVASDLSGERVAVTAHVRNPELTLISAIALTSTVWTSFQFRLPSQLEIILALAVAAAVGKIMGKNLGDRYSWQGLTLVTMSVAELLLAISGQNRVSLILGLGLLQSSIPITIIAMGRIMPKQPATAAGFALGLAILIGGIPIMGGLSYITGNPALSLWWVMKAMKNSSR